VKAGAAAGDRAAAPILEGTQVEVVAKWYWRMIVALLVAFAVLSVLRVVLLPQIPVWLPLSLAGAGYVLLFFACAVDELHLLWIAHAERLQALCVGFSLKLFDWRLGDLSHLRRPGGALFALGPVRLAWRFSP
jgi:hypothetical protein